MLPQSQPMLTRPSLPFGLSMTWRVTDPASVPAALKALTRHLSANAGWDWIVVGLGSPLTASLRMNVPGLIPFPGYESPLAFAPSTQQDLWLLIQADDKSSLFDRAQGIKQLLSSGFEVSEEMETFVYRGGRDLTGYVDGTENPEADAIPSVVFSDQPGLENSAFATVQRWEHRLAEFHKKPQAEQDNIIGRRLADNEELEDAPESAHVKRSAQEDFDPEAFMLRRSMPWVREQKAGIEFIAYAKSTQPFDQIMKRMVGLEDGVADALFSFSSPVTGGHYWCPPPAFFQ